MIRFQGSGLRYQENEVDSGQWSVISDQVSGVRSQVSGERSGQRTVVSDKFLVVGGLRSLLPKVVPTLDSCSRGSIRRAEARMLPPIGLKIISEIKPSTY